MYEIDPRKNWTLVEKRLAAETDPTVQRNLAVVLNHIKAEAQADFETLMSTVAEDARYHFFGSEDDPAFAGPKGKDNVANFYQMVINVGIHRIEHDLDRVVADRHSVTTEGLMKIAYPGALLQEMGHDIDDPHAYYIFQTRQMIVWPINDDGLIAGEDSYSGADGFEGIAGRKISADAIYKFDTPDTA